MKITVNLEYGCEVMRKHLQLTGCPACCGIYNGIEAAPKQSPQGKRRYSGKPGQVLMEVPMHKAPKEV
jgi:hypothetical protein